MKTSDLKERAALTCKLTSKELQHRKQTILADLKSRVLVKKELKNGYQYSFQGTDMLIDQLAEFIKTERLCCDFFEYEIQFPGDPEGKAKMKITGPDGVKDFIREELGL